MYRACCCSYCWAASCASRAGSGGLFAVLAALSAWLLCNLFSRAFGNTWTEGEVVVLLVSNLHWWLLALVPGLGLLFALERLRT
ncbi:hypothetical protein G3435_12890 [Pseudomonas sp. MAFF212428]|uniref:Uncharacterized protein n=1 Tax=Pseudomonas brassicae TaxID=2708063 RepID=A0A6M0CW72_9PSED|nr:hypothetical protein [Pseudomonas brassicae]